jgi:5-methylcytosine-specific restriction endonuclease McrA
MPKAKLADKLKSNSKLDSEIETLGAYPYPCPNCGKPVQNKRLFCSSLCRDEAKFVRYFRGCIADGRYKQEDVKEALRIRLAHILNRGYREHLRRIPDEIRKAVFERDNDLCKCGRTGNQIHHVNGDSNDIENLRTICLLCHMVETRKKIIEFTKESHPELWDKCKKLVDRAFSLQPLRFCDDFKWNKLWAAVKRARYKNYRTHAPS